MIEHLRSYEVSIWTLQDSLVTILKPSNLEHKGQIVDPIMTLKDDGENKFSFKIPMYIEDDYGIFKENPMWYNTQNGVILSGLRKIKVIFNKTKPEEEVYEFMIISVKEHHEGKKKYCEIESEGLAFHELGKQGYTIIFEGGEEIYYAQEAFFKGESSYSSCPEPTINYWADKVFKNTNWKYSVQMDYTGFDGRDSTKIYEDPYVASWVLNDTKDNLIPSTVTELTEKTRLIEAKESNRYNLSQTIAETFQVYCKYKYYYDENYHIIKREAIFYNNFLNESQGVIDLTYKYNTEHLTRMMDSSDLVTKMFVRPLTDKDMPSGETIISETAANKSGEDYILNFDYLYNIGAISQEQYDEIEPYQRKLGVINKEYNELVNNLIKWNDEKLKLEARKKTAEDALAATIEALNDAKTSAGRFLTTGNTGTITISERNPHAMYAIPNGRTYYCNFKIDGINPSTVKIYNSYDAVAHEIDGEEIKNFVLINDEYGNVTKAENITGLEENSYTVYATFTYTPKLYYDNIINALSDRYTLNSGIIADAGNKLDELKREIESAESREKELLKEKNNIIDSFERLMGPALREGTWQPEDDYAGYGEMHEDTLSLSSESSFDDSLCSIGWDEKLFDDEQDIKYPYGIELTEKYYSCIEVPSSLSRDNLTNLTFVYPTGEPNESPNQYMVINSKMSFCFLKEKKETTATSAPATPAPAIPALILLDKTPTEEQLSNGHLAYVTFGNGEINEVSINWNYDFIDNINDYTIVYPRIKINSNLVKSYRTEVHVKKEIEEDEEEENENEEEENENKKNKYIYLENYKDFYIFYRDSAYYITLKPDVLLNNFETNNFETNNFETNNFGTYKVQYTISNSALAIYLDALKVLKENSFPKVSYEIDLISANRNFIYNAYQHLGQIAHINDYEFKFNNVMGYISELNLDLNRPWQDKVTIKNYKTKFEDLFSTIVAQTEQMKKNSALINIATSAFNADGSLSDITFSDLLSRLPDYSTEAVSPEIEYLKYEPYIRQKLKETYIEAGQILSAAQQSVSAVNNLNLYNADILGSFQEDIGNKLTPTNFKYGIFLEEGDSGPYERTYLSLYNVTLKKDADFFKVGDILTYRRKEGKDYIEDTYVATENSNQITYEEQEDWRKSLKGWSLIYNGSLAQIKGANLDVDAKTGKIQILAENEINIASDGKLKLSGEDILIQGNKTVQIGGPDIKIYSCYEQKEEEEILNQTKGIHIYSSIYGAKDATSAVEVTGEGITVGAKGKIDIKSASGINIFSSDDGNTSAIKINRNDGIFLGSDKSITFYSGVIDQSGTSVKIDTNEILFGVSQGNEGTAVKLTKDVIVFGAGDVVNGTVNGMNYTNIGKEATGVQITKKFIRMANDNENGDERSYFSLSKDEITFSTSLVKNNELISGAYIKLSNNGQVIIGSDTNVETNNSTGFKSITSDNTRASFQVYAPNFIVDSEGYLYANGAHIAGVIKAISGQIGPENDNLIKIGESKVGENVYGAIYSINKPYKISNANGFYLGTDGLALGPTITTTDDTTVSKFQVNPDGTLYATGATVSGNVTANAVTTNISISSPFIEGGTITGTEIKTSNNSFYVSSTGDLIAHSVTITGGSQNYNDPKLPGYLDAGFSFSGENGIIKAKGVDISGTITAKSGNIGGWIIKNFGLYSNDIDDNETEKVTRIRISGNTGYTWPLAIGAEFKTDNSDNTDDSDGKGRWDWGGAPFRVKKDGSVYATKAEISGKVTATSGAIGGWIIKNHGLYSDDIDKKKNDGTQEEDHDGTRIRISGKSGYTWPLAIGAIYESTSSEDDDADSKGSWKWSKAPFRVNKDGTMYCTNAIITGGQFNIKSSKDFFIMNNETGKKDIRFGYEGTISFNEEHRIQYDEIDDTLPMPLHIIETTGPLNKNGNFIDKDRHTSYIYLWGGELRFASPTNGEVGLYDTMISAGKIETPELFTTNVSIRDNYIHLSSGKATGNIAMIAGKNKIGLQADTAATTSWEDNWNTEEEAETTYKTQWIIYKGVSTNNIYLDSSTVKMRNSNNSWTEIATQSDLSEYLKKTDTTYSPIRIRYSGTNTFRVIVNDNTNPPEIPEGVERVLWIKLGSMITSNTAVNYQPCDVYWVRKKT